MLCLSEEPSGTRLLFISSLRTLIKLSNTLTINTSCCKNVRRAVYAFFTLNRTKRKRSRERHIIWKREVMTVRGSEMKKRGKYL